MPDVIRVRDTATKAELAEALTHLAHYAARQMHHPDCTQWVTAHQRIDALLEDYEQAPA